MNLKKAIAVTLAVAAVFTSFGCGGGKQSSSGASADISAQQKKTLDEAAIKELVKQFGSPNIEERKNVCPFEKLPEYVFHSTPIDKHEFSFNQTFKIDSPVISDIKQDGDFASAKVSYIGGDKKHHHETWSFIRREGKVVYKYRRY